MTSECILTVDDERLPRFLDLSGEQSQQIHACLDKLFLELNASCVFLSDFQGHVYSRVGCRDDAQVCSVLSELGHGLETMLEATPLSGGKPDSVHLVYQEREQDNRIAVNVGEYFMLVLIVARGEHSARLGTIWYHLRKCAVDLRVLIEI